MVNSSAEFGGFRGFTRISNEKIRSLHTPSASGAITSLRELGLYSLLSSVLSNPSFVSANGGLQSLLLKHCKNRYYSLHKSWNMLSSLGLLKRIRVPLGLNRFIDYYELLHLSDCSLPSVRNLSMAEGVCYSAEHRPFLPPEQDFTMVSNTMLLDSRLSLSAKGLYALLARKLRICNVCKGEPLSKDSLYSLCREGKNAFDSFWRELRRFGYLILTRTWDAKNKKSVYRYTLNPVGSASEEDETSVSSDQPHSAVSAEKASASETKTERTSVPDFRQPSFVSDTPPSPEDIRNQIEYSCLLPDFPKDRLDLIVSILSEQYRTAFLHPKNNIRIAQDSVPASDLYSILSKLRGEEIRFVLDSYTEAMKTVKIRNARKYILSCLYHAKDNFAASLDTFAGSLGF